jgi:phage tail-like protein
MAIKYDSGLKASDRHPASGKKGLADPGVTLRFLVSIPGIEIGEFQECSGLGVEYEVFEWAEGGENRFVHKLRGRAKFPNIVLKRGVTYEDAMIKWFKECADKTERKSVTIQLLAGDRKPIRKWAFDGAFPIKWTGPTFNAGQGSPAQETLELVHQGFSAAV